MTSHKCVYDALVSALSPRRGRGWETFNAVCCSHNGGHRPDTKGRGGIKHDGSGVVGYHCFNCGYSARFTPGWNLSNKMKNILLWSGAPNSVIKRLEYDVWLLKNSMTPEQQKFDYKPKIKLDFKKQSMPKSAKPLSEWVYSENPPAELMDILEYAETRLYGDILKYDLWWTPEKKIEELKVFDINKRLLIPFKWNGEIVGWTGRKIIKSSAAKYFSSEPHDYMFNTESIEDEDKYIFIVEGPMDALAIDGVGMLGDRCSKNMADWLNDQNKEIIVIPDRMNMGGKLVDVALEQGWYVSFPEWSEGIKDACDAVHKYGKLYTVQSILEYSTSDKIKINVKRKIKLK